MGRVSYRNKVLEGSTVVPVNLDLIAKNLAWIELIEGDHLCPMVFFAERVLHVLSQLGKMR